MAARELLSVSFCVAVPGNMELSFQSVNPSWAKEKPNSQNEERKQKRMVAEVGKHDRFFSRGKRMGWRTDPAKQVAPEQGMC